MACNEKSILWLNMTGTSGWGGAVGAEMHATKSEAQANGGRQLTCAIYVCVCVCVCSMQQFGWTQRSQYN